MIPLALGLGLVAALLWAAGSFARAPVGGVKVLLAWVAALAGLSLMAMLVLTGRGGLALGGLLLGGPAVWRYWQQQRRAGPRGSGGARAGPRLGRTEALSVLGLEEGASDADVQAAWVRLMRVVHPDGGGSDWLAARVNQARDVLLRR